LTRKNSIDSVRPCLGAKRLGSHGGRGPARLHYNGTLRTVITAGEIPASGELRVAAGAIVTPSARDLALERGVKIVELAAGQLPALAPPEKTVALGADHGGFRLKEALKPVLAELGFAVCDCGVLEETPADYPDIALKVAEMVAGGLAARGVVIDGAGIGSAIAANKVPGIRAALCYDRSTARSSREHNDSNVLTLGGRLLTATQAEEVLRTWMATPFGGGRHAARIRKITEIEKRYSTWTARNSNNS
jgi:ribose 5-phosphate isomerase B